MMTYDLLGAKLILEKTKSGAMLHSKSESVSVKKYIGKILTILFPFFNYKIDLTTSNDWDIDS